MERLVVQLNARIHNQREQLAHANFVIGRLRTRVLELEEALKAIDKSAFIALTQDSDETRTVALESVHDIAVSAGQVQ